MTRRYPAHKASGVKWLGDIPKGWEICSLRGQFRELRQKNENLKSENYLSLVAGVGVIPYAEKGDIGNKKPDDLEKCKIVQKGNFVINSMNFGIGAFGVSAHDGICSPVYVVLEPIEPQSLKFLRWIFDNQEFQETAQSFGNGILAHRAAIGWDVLKSMAAAMPSLPEQLAIASFLDRETAKIDALVDEQKRLIELLKEKRQAVITRAVTKGLNPSAPMKPSGVEWLGDIPAHWSTLKLKRVLAEALSYGAIESSGDVDPKNPRFIRITDIDISGQLRSDTFCSLPLEIASPYMLKDGDVLFARSGATVGKLIQYRAAWGPCCYAGYLIRARLNRAMLTPDFLEAYCQTASYWGVISREQLQATIQNFSAEKYGQIVLPRPPLEEQQRICSWLSSECGKLNVLIVEAERGISLLEERRAALISAAVTGKIDVLGLVREGAEPA